MVRELWESPKTSGQGKRSQRRREVRRCHHTDEHFQETLRALNVQPLDPEMAYRLMDRVHILFAVQYSPATLRRSPTQCESSKRAPVDHRDRAILSLSPAPFLDASHDQATNLAMVPNALVIVMAGQLDAEHVPVGANYQPPAIPAFIAAPALGERNADGSFCKFAPRHSKPGNDAGENIPAG